MLIKLLAHLSCSVSLSSSKPWADDDGCCCLAVVVKLATRGVPDCSTWRSRSWNRFKEYGPLTLFQIYSNVTSLRERDAFKLNFLRRPTNSLGLCKKLKDENECVTDWREKRLNRNTFVRLFVILDAEFLVKSPYLVHVHHTGVHNYVSHLSLLFWRCSGSPQWSKGGIAETHGINIWQALKLRTWHKRNNSCILLKNYILEVQ